MSREEMVQLVRRRARKLGRNPTLRDLHGVPGFQERVLYQHFTGLGEVLTAAGLKPAIRNAKLTSEELLLDWAEVARKLKALPSGVQYRRAGRFTARPLMRRFGGWVRVPQAFRRFARQQGIEKEWADVVRMVGRATTGRRMERSQKSAVCRDDNYGGGAQREIARVREVHRSQPGAFAVQSAQTRRGPRAATVLERHEPRRVTGNAAAVLRPGSKGALGGGRRLRWNRLVYGAPLLLPGMAHAPVNEAGVVYLFGVVAGRLGFVVERMQSEFPDCEALYEFEPDKFQRVRIEFEYASRNFESHGHRARECDMIVCWVDDWEGCPRGLEVLELRKVVERIG